MQIGKPRIFVSSTISDFADLRSALKYWLEDMGFEVRMSEYVDFQRNADDGTFDSCFKAIAECNYFVLLVGGRKGSDFANGISVTQQEYRVAARLAEDRLIKPIVLIRKEVMTALSERSALQSAGIDGTLVHTARSKVLQDPEFVAGFIDEIRQTHYRREGTEGRSGAVWYYQFETFREITDALRSNLYLNQPISRLRLLSNLRGEIIRNVRHLCTKTEIGIVPVSETINSLRQDSRLSRRRPKEVVLITRTQYFNLLLFYTKAYWLGRLETSALELAINSGEFIVHQQHEGLYPEGPVQDLMRTLLQATTATRRYVSLLRDEPVWSVLRLSNEFKPSTPGGFVAKSGLTQITWRAKLILRYLFDIVPPRLDGADVSTKTLRRILKLLLSRGLLIPEYYITHTFILGNVAEDTFKLSIALLNYIDNPNQKLDLPELNPVWPYPNDIEDFKSSLISSEQIEDWVASARIDIAGNMAEMDESRTAIEQA